MKKNILFIYLFLAFLISYSQSSIKKNASLNEFNKLKKERKYNEVIDLGNSLLKNKVILANDSLTTIINLSIGQIYFEQSKYDTSFKYLKSTYYYKAKDTLKLKILKSLAELNEAKGNYDKASQLIKEELIITELLFNKNSNELANVYNRLGTIYLRQSNYRTAKTYFKKSLEIVSTKSTSKKTTINLLINLSNCSNSDGDYELAIQYLNEAVKLEQEIYGTDNKKNIISYGNIALNYHTIDENDKAIVYQKKALELCNKLVPKSHPIYGSLYLNLGVYYNANNDLDNAFIYYEKALSILKDIYGETHPNIGIILNALGEYYEKKDDDENALNFYSSSIDLWEKALEKNHEFIANGYYSRGTFYQKKELYNLAIVDLEKSLNININIYGNNNDKVTNSYLYLADCYIKYKKYRLANKYLNLANKFFTQKNLNGTDYSNLENKLILEHYYSTRKNYLLALKNKSNKYIDSLMINYENALKLQDYIQKSYISNTSKEFKLKNTFDIYEDYINLLYEQNKDLSLAFKLSEKTKSRRLTEHFNLINAKNKKILPDSIFTKEQQINKDISYYQKQLYNLIQLKINSLKDSITSIENTLFSLKREKEQLVNLYKEKYPKYYQLKYKHQVASIASIQNKLERDQTILEYFIGDKNIFIFIISKNEFTVKKIKKDFSLSNSIRDFLYGINSYWSSSSTSSAEELNKKYTEYAYTLYSKLIKPVTSLIHKKIIIIPDGELHLVPFDALLTDKNDPKSYLINKYQISYNYSATNYLEILKKKSKSFKKELLAIAPLFNNNTSNNLSRNVTALKHNVDEAKAVSTLFNSKLLKNVNATKSNFLKELDNYSIIHLSTHAKSNRLNGEYSYIIFQDSLQNSIDNNNNRLSASELYNLNLSTDMVVLSACETGIGEVKKGEGIVSLAHGFSYAGVKSIIASLWSVNDIQTSVLMKLFYTNIKKGMPKDEALRAAKLEYIASENLKAPYFWAGFISMGDVKPIKSNYNFTPVLLITLSFIIISIIYYKRKKPSI